jgi:Holliday junction resolvasome RuvABC endonuclease subunit
LFQAAAVAVMVKHLLLELEKIHKLKIELALAVALAVCLTQRMSRYHQITTQ